MRTILFCYLAAAMACKNGNGRQLDICSNYGHRFDIKFNPLKSQTTVFGGFAPSGFVLKLNEAPVPYVDKVKYLGIYIKSRTNCVDPSGALRNFLDVLTISWQCCLSVRLGRACIVITRCMLAWV